MDYFDKGYCIEVWGDMACFTRPELKVERVSYDVITPSAARAIFDAIFWKPAIRWQVTKIEVLSPIKWTSIRRNEVAHVAKNWHSIFMDDVDKDGKPKYRIQRNSLLLKDVHYRLYATLVFIPPKDRKGESRKAGSDENPCKYQAMFERRANKGQCFNQPYLGTREFSASYKLINNEAEMTIQPINEDRDFGIMLYDMDFTNPDNIKAMYYRVSMKNGIIIVPPINSEEVLR